MSRGYQPPQPGYSAPQSAARRAPIWLGAVAAAVLGVVGFGVVGVAVLSQSNRSSIGIGTTPTAVGSGATHPLPSRTPSPSENDAARAREGDCLSITGARDAPLVRLVPCGTPGSYVVVRRFDGTVDTGRCATVPESTSWYRQENPDFVLCLRK
jgi:hypothetical protein